MPTTPSPVSASAPQGSIPPRAPKLTRPIAEVRSAVRRVLEAWKDAHDPRTVPGDTADVLVGLSGGADSLALALATAFEAHQVGMRAGAIIIDHGLQQGSEVVAENAAGQAREFGLHPVIVRRVEVGAAGGPEAAARDARYSAFADAVQQTGARGILLGHTLDDQAETVLLGLARGSGAASLSGMSPDSVDERGTRVARPLLGIRRSETEQFCADSQIEFWSDPHNDDRSYQRVRVRTEVLPQLEREIGPGITEALARTAEQLREDDDAFQQMIDEFIEEIVEPAEAGISVSVGALEANPAALRQRIIRYVVRSEFGVSLSRAHTLAVAALVTDWRGQKALHLPGIRVVREGNWIVFSSAGLEPAELL